MKFGALNFTVFDYPELTWTGISLPNTCKISFLFVETSGRNFKVLGYDIPFSSNRIAQFKVLGFSMTFLSYQIAQLFHRCSNIQMLVHVNTLPTI